MRTWESDVRLLIVALIITGFCGCKAPFTQPKFMSPTLDASDIDVIHVMPLLEFSAEFNVSQLEPTVWKAAKIRISEKGYGVIRVQDKSLVNGIKRDEFSKPDSKDLASIGPPEAKWLLFFVFYENRELTGVAMKNGVPVSHEYIPVFELSAYLFDRSKGELIWSNSHRIGDLRPEAFDSTTGITAGLARDVIFISTIMNVNGLPNKDD
jgi:hypothetical protein